MPFFAIGAIDLVVFVVALAAILLLLAGDKFFQVIAAVFSHVPVIGSTIAGAISQYLVKTMADLASSLEKYTASVGEFFWGLLVSTWHLLYQQVDATAHMYQWLLNVAASVEHALVLAVSQSQAYTDHAIQTQVGNLSAVLPGLEAQIAALPAEVAAGTAAAEALAHSLADQVQSEAVTLFGQAEAAAAAGTAEAEALAHSLADEVQSEAVTLFGQAEGAITIIQGQVQALPGLIEGTIPGVIDGIVPGIIAGAIPGILAQVIPRVAALEAQADECLEPLCETVTPNAGRLGNLGNLFKNLEDLGIEALMIALAVEAVHDPQAVVDDVTSVVSSVGGGALQGFRDLVGV